MKLWALGGSLVAAAVLLASPTAGRAQSSPANTTADPAIEQLRRDLSWPWQPTCGADLTGSACTDHLAREWFKLGGGAPGEDLARAGGTALRVQVSRDRRWRPMIIRLESIPGTRNGWVLTLKDNDRPAWSSRIVGRDAELRSLLTAFASEAAQPEARPPTRRNRPTDEVESVCMHSDHAVVEVVLDGAVLRRAQDSCPAGAQPLFTAISRLVGFAQNTVPGCAPNELWEEGFRIDLAICLGHSGDRVAAEYAKRAHQVRWEALEADVPRGALLLEHVRSVYAAEDTAIVTGDWSIGPVTQSYPPVYTATGDFAEVWKRQPDGSWRLDQGYGLPTQAQLQGLSQDP